MANNQSRIWMLKMVAVAGFILMLVVGWLLIYPAQVKYEQQRQVYMQIKAEADRKRAERDQLAREVAALESSPEAIERVARINYRLCKEGETVLYYKIPRK